MRRIKFERKKVWIAAALAVSLFVTGCGSGANSDISEVSSETVTNVAEDSNETEAASEEVTTEATTATPTEATTEEEVKPWYVEHDIQFSKPYEPFTYKTMELNYENDSFTDSGDILEMPAIVRLDMSDRRGTVIYMMTFSYARPNRSIASSVRVLPFDKNTGAYLDGDEFVDGEQQGEKIVHWNDTDITIRYTVSSNNGTKPVKNSAGEEVVIDSYRVTVTVRSDYDGIGFYVAYADAETYESDKTIKDTLDQTLNWDKDAFFFDSKDYSEEKMKEYRDSMRDDSAPTWY